MSGAGPAGDSGSGDDKGDDMSDQMPSDSEAGSGPSEAGKQEAEPPEFYDEAADDRDEQWLAKARQGRKSDAILSCPACFTTVCIDCQQHERYENQFRALLVMNCKVKTGEVVKFGDTPKAKRRVKGTQDDSQGQAEPAAAAVASKGPPGGAKGDWLSPVVCAACETEVGLRDMADGVYHLFNVFASNA